MYVLSQIIGNHKALGSSRLHEDSLKVDQLWAGIDFLKLFTRKFKGTLSQLGLGRGLRLKLLFNDTWALVSLGTESFSCFEVGVGLIFTDRFLYIE
jgi:hypothetical protein